jgi:hypothetical protein
MSVTTFASRSSASSPRRSGRWNTAPEAGVGEKAGGTCCKGGALMFPVLRNQLRGTGLAGHSAAERQRSWGAAHPVVGALEHVLLVRADMSASQAASTSRVCLR